MRACILIVDDDNHVRDSLVDELGRDYQVDTACCGTEAFDALTSRRYDVVISDLRMPDHDGIEVLDFARRYQHDVVRILLTGYLDERASRALLAEDAPYKVGKPWHDEIEVVVRRALEHREVSRRLNASVADALDMARFDGELAGAATAVEVADAIVRRGLAIDGLATCGVISRESDGDQVIAGAAVSRVGLGWYVDLPLDGSGEIRLRARGIGDGARQLIGYLASRAQRRAGVLEARVTPAHAPHARPGRQRVSQLIRQATMGAMASSLLHDLASVMQAMSGALEDVSALAESAGVIDLKEAVAEAVSMGEEAVGLFVTMRKFIRLGEIAPRPIAAAALVQRAVRLAAGYVRERCKLAVGAGDPTLEVAVAEPLFVQVLVNLLRNAANASPANGVVELTVTATPTEITFSVIDDGPGVSAEVGDTMFEPFAGTSRDGAGLGLAIGAYVMQLHGGGLRYQRAEGRGSCFTAALPRVGG